LSATLNRVMELDDVDGVAFTVEDGGVYPFKTSPEHLLGALNARTDTNWDA
jgi:hypothetical protein